jgi:hypothetical protein
VTDTALKKRSAPVVHCFIVTAKNILVGIAA